MSEMYKIVFRNLALGTKSEFVCVVPDVFMSYDEARTALLNKGKELEKQIASLISTKLDLYRYSTQFVEDISGNEENPMKAVVVQYNRVTFCSIPVAYLQIVKV